LSACRPNCRKVGRSTVTQSPTISSGASSSARVRCRVLLIPPLRHQKLTIGKRRVYHKAAYKCSLHNNRYVHSRANIEHRALSQFGNRDALQTEQLVASLVAFVGPKSHKAGYMSEPPVPPSGPKQPVVETPPDGPAHAEVSRRALNLRIRQQEILAELGVAGLKGIAFEQLLDTTVRLAAEGLEAELCKVLEYIPSDKRLLMRAGLGWDPGLVGTASVGADLESPSGFALRTGKPVISNHLENEERFRTPELLAAHSVRRAINVILQGDGAPYGILEVDSRSEGEFSEQDIAFLQGAANILGMAIERQRHERRLKQALEHQHVLVKEINHRVKNSLQLVSSMLSLQAGNDPAFAQRLQDASSRIAAIARAHDRLYRSPQIEEIDLGGYLVEVCRDLTEVTPHCEVSCDTPEVLFMSTDRAICAALVVTELVTNAAKHGYPNGQSGHIWVRLTRGDGGTARISVRDGGLGLPPDFEIGQGGGLGMRLTMALAQQADAVVRTDRLSKGTEFVIELPLERG
jgi:two-component sensor histidine kinase